MTDATTPVAELRKLVADFVAARDWHQFHSPKNLAMALAVEAAELMEHFQWLTGAASREVSRDQKKLADIGAELADVVCYSLALANELGLDVATIVGDKMVIVRVDPLPLKDVGRRQPRGDAAGDNQQ